MLEPPLSSVSDLGTAADLLDPPVTGALSYFDDPCGFVRDCFRWAEGEGPTAYQLKCMARLVAKRRLAVRGPHGLGKTGQNAWVVLWFALTRDAAGIDWKAATTASAWRQLEKYLWPEIHKWAKRLRWDVIGRGPFKPTELMTLSLKLEHGEAFACACEDPAKIEGAHADEMLFVFDEAKRLDVATPIPTPEGWKAMGEIAVGDMVLDEEGRPTRVSYVSPILEDRPCSRVRFSDNSELIADDGHLWASLPYAYRQQQRGASDWRDFWDEAAIVETRDLETTPRWAIPTCRPLELPEVDLPVDPYVLGAWLGDGTSLHGSITTMDEEVLERLTAAGHPPTWAAAKRSKASTRGVYGLFRPLRLLGLIGNKHIPSPYLRASLSQRLELLRGLMDTDGTVMGTSRVSYVSKSRLLAAGVAELVATFGWKVAIRERPAVLNGVDHGPVYMLRWSADICPFHLARKAQRWQARGVQASRGTIRTVVSVGRVPSVPTRCIAVESPRHLYLAGRAFIPTHNTIPPETFDAAEGAFSGGGEDTAQNAYALASSTPGSPIGRFYEIHQRVAGLDDWDALHVTLEDVIRAGRVSKQWADNRRRQWGADSAVFINRVLGNFAASEEDGVIPLSWVEAAQERWHALPAQDNDVDPLKSLGADIARSGKDRTIVALRFGNAIRELRKLNKQGTMETAGQILGILEAHHHPARQIAAVVDVIGIGAGVVDRLRETAKEQVVAFNASERSDRKDSANELGFVNCLSGDARIRPVGQLLRIYRTRYEGPLFHVKTSCGDDFTATANHNVLTPRGWVAIQNLNVGDQLCDSAVRDATGRTTVGPEVDDVPPMISEVYGAAYRLFGSERVLRRAVNFHGDRPADDVDVVTIDSSLLSVRPSDGEMGKDHLLLALLMGKGAFARGGPFPQSLWVGHVAGGIRAVLPHHCVTARTLLALREGQPIEREVVGLTLGPRLNPGLAYGANDREFTDPERSAERLSGFARDVTADDKVAVEIDRPREASGLGGATWLDALFAQGSSDGAPLDPEMIRERVQGLAREIASDYVVSIEMDSTGNDGSFVYTLETSTGSYQSARVLHRNCRAASWWNVRELLDPDSDHEVALPPDDALLGELTCPKWIVMSGGKIKIESKDEIRKRLSRSTDHADAVVMAFWLDGGVSVSHFAENFEASFFAEQPGSSRWAIC